MEGVKLEQTKQAMESILDQLRPDDLFSVIEFSSTALVSLGSLSSRWKTEARVQPCFFFRAWLRSCGT